MISQKGTKVSIVFDAASDDGYEYGRINEFRPGHEHPFLYPAYDSNVGQIKQDLEDAIRKAAEK